MTQNGLQQYNLGACTLQFSTWKPFLASSEFPEETLSVGSFDSQKIPLDLHLNGLMEILSDQKIHRGTGPVKKQCLSDRGSRKNLNLCDLLDMSKLSLLDDESKKPQRLYHRSIRPISSAHMARKRRRRGSGSGSGRSSDKSRNRINGSDPPTRAASATYATCSDFPIAGTDSSGELFFNGDGNWVSEMVIPMSSDVKKGKEVGGEPFFSWQGIDIQSNESGYGSEPGYRGDEELGYGEDGAGDELDEEEDDNVRMSFWDNLVVLENIDHPSFDMSEDDDQPALQDHMQLVGKSTLQEQRLHHRFRRRRQDWRMLESNWSRESLVSQNN